MRNLLACCLVCLAAAACSVCPDNAAAQTGSRPPGTSTAETRPADEETLLRALLDEVRQLRVVLQRTTVVTQRFQSTLERVRSQQARVDVLTREIEGVRLQLSNTEFARKQSEERAKELEERLSQEQDARLHAALESQSREFSRTLNLQAAQEERQREREAQLTAQLQIEQLKLGEINSRLDSLERELADLSDAKGQ
jgi:chromosome segregation ATPase